MATYRERVPVCIYLCACVCLYVCVRVVYDLVVILKQNPPLLQAAQTYYVAETGCNSWIFLPLFTQCQNYSQEPPYPAEGLFVFETRRTKRRPNRFLYGTLS